MTLRPALFLIAALAAAQTDTPAPAFEVASIKAKVVPRGLTYIPRSVAGPLTISGTRVTAQGALFQLMAAAYDVQFYQIAIAPGWDEKWPSREAYEIEARAPAPNDIWPTRNQVRAMLQTLLADRFQLKMHRESRQMPVYNLLAGSAPKLKPTTSTDPAKMEADGAPATQMRVRYTNYSIPAFIAQIMSQFDRPLLDKTGLTGAFDFTLEYHPQPAGMTAATAAALGVPDPDPGIPIVSAIQGQLGLKIVSATGPVEFLVIDHAERPAEN